MKKIIDHINNCRIRKQCVFLLVFILFSAPIYIRFSELDILTILDDEFGYWGSAIRIVGRSWQPLMNVTPYYSIGYSFLLVPIITVVSDTGAMYQVAIILNVVFLFIMFMVAYRLSGRLNENNSFEVRVLVSALSSMTVFNVFQVRTAWPEVLLSLLMWVIVALLDAIEHSSRRALKYVMLFATMFFMCLVHKRALPICAILLFVIVLHLMSQKKRGIYYAVCVCVVFIIAAVIYTNIIDWHAYSFFGDVSDYNNPTVQEATEKYFYRITEAFLYVLQSFMGKCAVNLVETYFLAPIVIVAFFHKIIRKEKRAEITLTEAFIVLSFIAMLLLITIQCYYPSRKDVLVYTRYSDCTVGPMILLGMNLVISKWEKIKRIVLGNIIVCLVMSKIILDYMNRVGTFFNVPCSPLIGGLFNLAKTEGSNNIENDIFIYLVKLSFFIFGVFYVLNENKKTLTYLAVGICAGFTILICHYSNFWLDDIRIRIRENIEPIYDVVCDSVNDIYFVIHEDPDDDYSNPKHLQYRLPQETIKTCGIEDITTLEPGTWVLTYCDRPLTENENQFVKPIEETKYLKLYRKK